MPPSLHSLTGAPLPSLFSQEDPTTLHHGAPPCRHTPPPRPTAPLRRFPPDVFCRNKGATHEIVSTIREATHFWAKMCGAIRVAQSWGQHIVGSKTEHLLQVFACPLMHSTFCLETRFIFHLLLRKAARSHVCPLLTCPVVPSRKRHLSGTFGDLWSVSSWVARRRVSVVCIQTPLILATLY